MNPRVYKDWLASQPCRACGQQPVQLHHVKGCRSLKTGEPLRPRNGLADVALLPLCTECHAELHETSEGVFEIDHLGGMGAALGFAFAYLARFMTEGRP